MATLLLVPGVCAGSENAILDELRREIAELSERVGALETENRKLRSVTGVAPESGDAVREAAQGTSPRAARVTVNGDFRYRYEEMRLEDAATHTRSRLRARLNVEGEVKPGLRLGAGLSTGGHSPVSSTQTLGDGGSKKEVTLDLAYMDWSPLEGLHVFAGKFRNPLFEHKSQTLLWDDEWRPEGIGFSFDRETWFAKVIGSWLESDSSSAARELVIGGQVGLRRDGGATNLTAGLGLYDIGASGKGRFFAGDPGFFGNSTDCTDAQVISTCTYRYDYRELEAFAVLGLDVAGLPFELHGHYVDNRSASANTSGWTVGAGIQTAVLNRPVRLDYFYRNVGADAVFGALADSDFGGGRTDVRGHYFKAGWSLYSPLALSVTYFVNRVGADAGFVREYERLQLSADFSF
jgi:opacity protein-like surface antigen